MEEWLIRVFVPTVIAITTMTIMLVRIRKADKALNWRKLNSSVHILNVSLALFAYSLTFTALYVILFGYAQGIGSFELMRMAFFQPLVFVVISYWGLNRFMRWMLRPYVRMKGSNVLYLKKSIYQGR
ncbi:hypothetical protein [Salsuginibacillus kocurii]|uniref:hypothetical protein n=1 Tax=Salsuginibacillus kocurii TaxID=427078 RepID=UPI00037AF81B|nr:hypothetical protein [Salsuginibacillus kocurii]